MKLRKSTLKAAAAIETKQQQATRMVHQFGALSPDEQGKLGVRLAIITQRDKDRSSAQQIGIAIFTGAGSSQTVMDRLDSELRRLFAMTPDARKLETDRW